MSNEELYHPAWEIMDSSKLQSFMDCPRRFFFDYILGWSSEMANHDLIFGQAFHDAMEIIMTNPMTEDIIEVAYQKFLETYRPYFPEETDELYAPKTPANAFYGLAAYVGQYRNQDFFTTLYTEVGGRVWTGKHYLIYKLDTICQDHNGRVFSFEHKTTKYGFKQVWLDEWLLSMQIGTYSYGLRCLYPDISTPLVIINGVAFSKKKVDCQRQPVKKTPQQLQTWLFTANYWIDQVKQEVDVLMNDCSVDDQVLTAFPLNPRACTNYFRLCPFHDFCMSWPNPLRYAFDQPPDGFQVHHWDPLQELPIKNRVDVGE